MAGSGSPDERGKLAAAINADWLSLKLVRVEYWLRIRLSQRNKDCP